MSDPYSRAQQYSAYIACTCAATSFGYGFPFDAHFLRVSNYAGKPIYVNFNSSAATTSNHFLSTGESLFGQVPPMRAISLISTSSGAEVSILALGY